MAAGDLLFYKSDLTSFFDKAISILNALQGRPDYVHVAIDYDGVTKIEMLGQGCVQMPIIDSTIAARWTFPETYKNTPQFTSGMQWLHQQIGQPYGWEDAIAQVDVQHKFVYLQTVHKDCSDLASMVLYKCGYDIIKIKGKDYIHKASDADPSFSEMTPGDLAKFLHVA